VEVFCIGVVFQFNPSPDSAVSHSKFYALEINGHCSPVIDHCIVHSSSVGLYLCLLRINFGLLNASLNFSEIESLAIIVIIQVYCFFWKSWKPGKVKKSKMVRLGCKKSRKTREVCVGRENLSREFS